MLLPYRHFSSTSQVQIEVLFLRSLSEKHTNEDASQAKNEDCQPEAQPERHQQRQRPQVTDCKCITASLHVPQLDILPQRAN